VNYHLWEDVFFIATNPRILADEDTRFVAKFPNDPFIDEGENIKYGFLDY
jgi:hypothetical protein